MWGRTALFLLRLRPAGVHVPNSSAKTLTCEPSVDCMDAIAHSVQGASATASWAQHGSGIDDSASSGPSGSGVGMCFGCGMVCFKDARNFSI